jgi:hypothetical protein
MAEYLDYFGATPMPGVTAQQDYAIELALRHGRTCRARRTQARATRGATLAAAFS